MNGEVCSEAKPLILILFLALILKFQSKKQNEKKKENKMLGAPAAGFTTPLLEMDH